MIIFCFYNSLNKFCKWVFFGLLIKCLCWSSFLPSTKLICCPSFYMYSRNFSSPASSLLSQVTGYQLPGVQVWHHPRSSSSSWLIRQPQTHGHGLRWLSPEESSSQPKEPWVKHGGSFNSPRLSVICYKAKANIMRFCGKIENLVLL